MRQVTMYYYVSLFCLSALTGGCGSSSSRPDDGSAPVAADVCSAADVYSSDDCRKDAAWQDQSIQVYDSAGRDQPVQVPDSGGQDQPVQIPDSAGVDGSSVDSAGVVVGCGENPRNGDLCVDFQAGYVCRQGDCLGGCFSQCSCVDGVWRCVGGVGACRDFWQGHADSSPPYCGTPPLCWAQCYEPPAGLDAGR